MKIGIDLNFWFADQRGMGRYVRNLLRHFLSEQSNFYLLFCRNEKEIATLNQQLADWGFRDNFEIKLNSVIPQTQVEAFWYPWNRIDHLPLSGVKFLTIHDLAPFAFPYRSIFRSLDQNKDEQRFRKAIFKADLIIAISGFTQNETMKYLNVSESKIQVVYCGVDERFKPHAMVLNQPPEWQKSLGLTTNFLLHVGVDEPRKNLFNLLKAFVLLRDSVAFNESLVLAGTGNPMPLKYHKFISQHHLEKQVLWLPEVSELILLELYRSASLLVFPSFYEGFGLPLLEAMACGLPVVCSDSSVFSEIGGDAALYFNPLNPQEIAEKISLGITDQILRNELRQKGLVKAREFTWQKTARKMLDVFAASYRR